MNNLSILQTEQPQNSRNTSSKKKKYIKHSKYENKLIVEIVKHKNGLLSIIFDILSSKESWVSDADVLVCRECNENFTILNRKHHCRCCGKIYCKNCSNYVLEIETKIWILDPRICEDFLKKFNCKADTWLKKFSMRLCKNCFQSELNDQLSLLYDEDGFAKNLRQSFVLSENRLRLNSIALTKRYALHDAIFKETSDFLRNEIEIHLDAMNLAKNVLDNFLTDLFFHFNNLMEFKIDYNSIHFCDLIPVVLSSSSEFKFEFYNGFILELDSINEETCKTAKNLPDILFVRRDFSKNYLQSSDPSQFKYLNLEDIEHFNNENFNLFQKAVEESDISIVISEFSLPAKIYFFLNSLNITVIAPVNNSKMNLIERLIKPSFSKEENSVYSRTNSREIFEKINFEGLFDLKKVEIFEKKTHYYALFKKKNTKQSFNSFSIIVNCAQCKITKTIKNKIQNFLPVLLYKFQEHAIVNNEMKAFDPFADYNFSKEFLQNKLYEITTEKSIGNFVYGDKDLIPLIKNHVKIQCDSLLCIEQTEKTTYDEFEIEFKKISASKLQLANFMKSRQVNFSEFNSCDFFREFENFSFLANINLSKHSEMMRLCGSPELKQISIMGLNDASLVKFLVDAFKEKDVTCNYCDGKLHQHVKMFYLNQCAIKMQMFSIEAFSQNTLNLKHDFDNGFSFARKVDSTSKKLFQFENFVDSDEIKASFYCFDCEKIFENLTVLPKLFQNLPLSVFLYLFSLYSQHDLLADSQNFERQPSKSRSFFQDLFRKKSDEYTVKCFHLKMARIFVKNTNLISFQKQKVTVFTLLSNKNIKSQKIEKAKENELLENLIKNLNHMIVYYTKFLSTLEDFIFQESNEFGYKENLILVNSAIEAFSKIEIPQNLHLSDKSQKDFDDSFFAYLQTICQSLERIKEILETTTLKFDCPVSLVQTDQLLKFLSDKKKEKIIDSFKSDFSTINRITEIRSTLKGEIFQTEADFPKIARVNSVHKMTTKLNSNEDELISEKHSIVPEEKRGLSFFFATEEKIRQNNDPVNTFARFLGFYSKNNVSVSENRVSFIKKELFSESMKMFDLRILDFKLSFEEESAFARLSAQKSIDFLQRFRNCFPPLLPLSSFAPQKSVVKEYFPRLFESLRVKNRIRMDYFIHSLANNTALNTTGGKTGTRFYITGDQKYVIKEISNREFKSFKTFAPNYVNYMLENSEEQNQSLICRIYALFKVNKIVYTVMENLTYFVADPGNKVFKYDLKGSERSRFSQFVLPGKTLMDTNFKIERNGDPISIEIGKTQKFWETLNRDSLFLSQHNIVDYSLFLILDVTDNCCIIKIIDFLREYDLIKIAENQVKLMTDKKAPTIVKPADYRSRFLANSRKYFIVHNSQKVLSETEHLPSPLLLKTKSSLK